MVINRDLKEVWQTGKFDNVEFSLWPLSDGTVRLVLLVKEKPLMDTLRVEGNQAFKEKELLEKSELKVGMAYDQYAADNAGKKIAEFYREREYYHRKNHRGR